MLGRNIVVVVSMEVLVRINRAMRVNMTSRTAKKLIQTRRSGSESLGRGRECSEIRAFINF